MKHIFLTPAIAILLIACQSNSISKQTIETPPDIHKVIVEEVLQTTNYTYLRVKEGEDEQWLAVTKMQATAGEVYYYKAGLLMTEFVSKELNRTFSKIIFLDQISKTPDIVRKEVPNTAPQSVPDPHSSMPVSDRKTPPEKKEIKIEPAKDGVTIAELFKNKQSFSGKRVKIKGLVTKFNLEIMNKNWIHIQDGTENDGKFDLTITSTIKVKVGDILTFEGVIALNRDFGYGYFYEVLMEEGQLVK